MVLLRTRMISFLPLECHPSFLFMMNLEDMLVLLLVVVGVWSAVVLLLRKLCRPLLRELLCRRLWYPLWRLVGGRVWRWRGCCDLYPREWVVQVERVRAMAVG